MTAHGRWSSADADNIALRAVSAAERPEALELLLGWVREYSTAAQPADMRLAAAVALSASGATLDRQARRHKQPERWYSQVAQLFLAGFVMLPVNAVDCLDRVCQAPCQSHQYASSV